MFARAGVRITWVNGKPTSSAADGAAVVVHVRFVRLSMDAHSAGALAYATPFARGVKTITVGGWPLSNRSTPCRLQGCAVGAGEMLDAPHVGLPIAYVLVVQPVNYVFAQDEVRLIDLGLVLEQAGWNQICLVDPVSSGLSLLTPCTPNSTGKLTRSGWLRSAGT
jgi:hypothetical protein